jgi:hypothetical protein
VSFLQVVEPIPPLGRPQGRMVWGLTPRTVSGIKFRAISVSVMAKFRHHVGTGSGRSPSVIVIQPSSVLLFLGAWGLVIHVGVCESVRRHLVAACEHGD